MAYDDERAVLEAQLAALNEEIVHLRARLADAPKRLRSLEERLLETKGQLAQAVAQNEKLSYTLREAREHIATLRDEVDKLSEPPSAYGVVVGKNDDGTITVIHRSFDIHGMEDRGAIVYVIEQREHKLRRKGEVLKEQLEKLSLSISKQVGEEEKLFGSVTNREIAAATSVTSQ